MNIKVLENTYGKMTKSNHLTIMGKLFFIPYLLFNVILC